MCDVYNVSERRRPRLSLSDRAERRCSIGGSILEGAGSDGRRWFGDAGVDALAETVREEFRTKNPEFRSEGVRRGGDRPQKMATKGQENAQKGGGGVLGSLRFGHLGSRILNLKSTAERDRSASVAFGGALEEGGVSLPAPSARERDAPATLASDASRVTKSARKGAPGVRLLSASIRVHRMGQSGRIDTVRPFRITHPES